MSSETSAVNRSSMEKTRWEFVMVKESELAQVESVLEGRLPKSANVYNMVKMYAALKPHVEVFSLGEEISEDSVILVNSYREEVDQDIGISAPDGFDASRLSEALISTTAVDWNKSFEFSCMGRRVAGVVFEVSTHCKGKLTHCNPCYVYVMDKSGDNYKEKVLMESEDVVLGHVDLQEGVQFLVSSWKYAEPKTEAYLQRILKTLPSSGLYVNGKIVSGAVQNTNGVIGMLFTDPEERNKGYGVKVLKRLLTELSKDGLAPCSVAEMNNLASQKLHEKVGMKLSHEVDYIWHSKQ